MRGQGGSRLIPWYTDMGLCPGQAPACHDVAFVSQTRPRDGASLGGSEEPQTAGDPEQGKVTVLLLLRFGGPAALGPALAPLLCC